MLRARHSRRWPRSMIVRRIAKSFSFSGGLQSRAVPRAAAKLLLLHFPSIFFTASLTVCGKGRSFGLMIRTVVLPTVIMGSPGSKVAGFDHENHPGLAVFSEDGRKFRYSPKRAFKTGRASFAVGPISPRVKTISPNRRPSAVSFNVLMSAGTA